METYGRQPEVTKCPFCAELIQPAARKCPHCQEVLDPALKREQAELVQRTVQQKLDEQELRDKLTQRVIGTSIGMVLFSGLGVLLGPIVLIYALYYSGRVKTLAIQRPATLTALYVLSGVWFTLGALLITWLIVGARGH